MTKCGICGAELVEAVVGSERMFGMGGEFRYGRCVDCGCLQLLDVPEDSAPYYARGYYAFDEAPAPSAVRQLYRQLRDALLIGRARALGSVILPFLPPPVGSVREWLRTTGVTRESRILDVGCGAGLLVRRLRDAGYARAEGVDPFVAADVRYDGRVLVRKATIHDMTGPYDLIMFHHSLEHIADQRHSMARVAALLTPGGWCLARVPTVSSFAWEHYRDRWVQLDAPRHLYLHSLESMRRLAATAELRVERVVFDSTSFQFGGSELYRRDRPLSELRSSRFAARRVIDGFRARRLNAASRGDQAAFYLRRA